jgi:hypothetical protein
MATLPPPSTEQQTVLRRFVDEQRDVAVTAVAGAGKSTLLLHVCAAFPDDEVLVVAYNAPLAAEMNERLLAAGLRNATAYTFHSLASAAFRLCPDDNTLAEIIEEAHAHGMHPRKWFAPKHLLLDEMQDMRDLFWEMLRLVVDLPNTHTLICGDKEQMLYDFEEDDPAKLDYLERPQDFFRPTEWVHERLSVSFRLTPPVTALVNVLKGGEGLVAGNLPACAADAPKPAIITCGIMEWSKMLMPILRSMLRDHKPERIAVLARSVRTTHPSMRTLVNAACACGVPVYVHSVDAAHASVREKKVTFATYYASKGLTFDACITLGVDEESDINPVYVATSRSRCKQVLVLDSSRPPRRLLQALRDGLDCTICSKTRDLVRYGYRNPDEEMRAAPALKDVTTWQPRGRSPALHAAIGTTMLSVPGEHVEALRSEYVFGPAGQCDDVTQIYVMAALMCEEHRQTGVCGRMQQVYKPQRASRSERLKRAIAGDGTRMVDTRARADELFPERLYALLQRTQREESQARRWCAAAVAASAFGTFHHRVERLLTSIEEWADEELFEAVRGRIQERIQERNQERYCGAESPGKRPTSPARPRFDVMVRHVGMVTTTTYRCDVLVGDAAWLVVYGDSITPGIRLRACVPAAVAADEVRTCCVLNVRTGEVQRMCLNDPQAFRDRIGTF